MRSNDLPQISWVISDRYRNRVSSLLISNLVLLLLHHIPSTQANSPHMPCARYRATGFRMKACTYASRVRPGSLMVFGLWRRGVSFAAIFLIRLMHHICSFIHSENLTCLLTFVPSCEHCDGSKNLSINYNSTLAIPEKIGRKLDTGDNFYLVF